MDNLFERHLRHHNVKLTPPRRRVFQVLQAAGPLPTKELIAQVGGAVDRASIYRTLQLFEELGVIHHLILGGRKVVELTDSFSHHHHHLSCARCGKLQSVHDERLETALQRLVEAHGFDARGHLIEVSGLCRDCATLGAGHGVGAQSQP
jgi:Fur family ferric uptake transcriptional regulator